MAIVTSRVKPLWEAHEGWDRMTGKRQTLERFSHPEETATPRDGHSATTKGHQRTKQDNAASGIQTPE